MNYPPDTRACIFWLRNRQRGTWSDRASPPADDFDDVIAGLEAGGELARQERVHRRPTLIDFAARCLTVRIATGRG